MPFHSRLVLADAHNDELNPTWTVHYIVEDDFALRYVRIYPVKYSGIGNPGSGINYTFALVECEKTVSSLKLQSIAEYSSRLVCTITAD